MNRLIGLWLISLLFVGGRSESNIFKEPENVISAILNIFESSFTQSVRNTTVNGADHVPNQSNYPFREQNDTLCMEQVNAILRGVNNSELWAIKGK